MRGGEIARERNEKYQKELQIRTHSLRQQAHTHTHTHYIIRYAESVTLENKSIIIRHLFGEQTRKNAEQVNKVSNQLRQMERNSEERRKCATLFGILIAQNFRFPYFVVAQSLFFASDRIKTIKLLGQNHLSWCPI